MKELFTVVLSVALFLCLSCSKDNPTDPPSQGNQPPAQPSQPSPAIGATDQDTMLELSWVCNDPDGDSLIYDVYLEAFSTPHKIASNLTVNRYEVTGLQQDETYYWQILAKDPVHDFVRGPVWVFHTKELQQTLIEPNPVDDATAVATSARFTWQFAPGPTGGVVYDFYLGESGNPTLRASGLTQPSNGVSGLGYGTEYQWYVVARQQNAVVATGPTWHFTVREELTTRGRYVSTPQFPTCIAVSGNRLYVCSLLLPYWETGNLYVYDISSPDAPVILGGRSIPKGGPQDLAINGSTAFILQVSDGLTTMDVSDPSLPRYLTNYDYSGAVYEAVTLNGQYAYVTAFENSRGAMLLTFDVSDPSSLRLVSELNGVRGRVAIYDSYGYAEADGQLAVLSVADPSSPQLILTTDFARRDLFVNYPVLISGYFVYSIENPAAPSLVGEIPSSSLGTHPDVTVRWGAGDLVVAQVTYNSATSYVPYVALIDVSQPEHPLIVKEYLFDCVTDVASDGRVIVAAGRERPCQINVSSGEIQVFDF